MERKKLEKGNLPLPAKTKFSAYPQEEWKEFQFADSHLMNRRYAISNFGRFASFINDLRGDGVLLKPALHTNRLYNLVRGNFQYEVTVKGIKKRKKSEQKILIHTLAARIFLKNPENKKNVLHKDFDTFNNHVDNLFWATKEEAKEHRSKDPRFIAYSEKKKNRGKKLTATSAMVVKKMALEGKTRKKMIAKQFGISEMGVYRVQRGENWGHLNVDSLSNK
jgi:hypothetical protein